MTRYTFGTALRAATLAAAIGALASPAFAQNQTGTGGGAGGDSGSSKATDMNKGPINPTAGSARRGSGNTGHESEHGRRRLEGRHRRRRGRRQRLGLNLGAADRLSARRCSDPREVSS